MDCLFCKIAAGEIPSTKVYEDETVYAFRDINPQAPVHVVIIPKKHIGSADEVDSSNSSYVATVFEKIPEIAKTLGGADRRLPHRQQLRTGCLPVGAAHSFSSAWRQAACRFDGIKE